MTLFLNNDDIAQVLDPAAFIATLEAAYRDYAAGNGVCLPRLDLHATVGADAAYQLGVAIGAAGPRYAAIRVKSDRIVKRMVSGQPRKDKYCVTPGMFMGLVLLFDVQTGGLLALMHDGLIQTLRVAADSAIGVRLLARPDAHVLAILGAGGMARTHLQTLRLVRPLDEVRIFSPTRENRAALAREAQRSGLHAVAAETPEAALLGADLVAGCTNALGPVVPGALLEPGMHVTCIGGTLDQPASARLDIALRFGNPTRPVEFPAWRDEDDWLSYAAGGALAGHGSTRRYADPRPGAQLMLADLLENPGLGRRDASQITFSERGSIQGLEFAAIAGLVFERAAAAGLGHSLPDEMFLETIRN